MLIVSNGAFKSGSTWMFKVIQKMSGIPLVPERFRRPRWSARHLQVGRTTPLASIAPNRLARLLVELDYHENDFTAKNHFRSARQRRLLLKHDDVLVINIIRDLRDVIVSAYYHDRRTKQFRRGFRSYYWGIGRMRALQVLAHNRRWAIDSPRVFTSSYEKLHNAFPEEVRAYGALLGLSLDDEEIEALRESTSLGALRRAKKEEDSEERFFRKGIIGDWQNHFDQAMEEDIELLIAGSESFWIRSVFRLRAFFRISPFMLIRAGSERFMRFFSDRG